ncbi:uncharacterized protein LOC125856860 [Solanum stenotomum]|uniref:uncharacterized protein LOC125856860 n=1 Tax=Solanum stenotomum TaxID=172797 RepID=UPI0020D17F3A|nr:uncharacterized protein LOC125856860 [Solanum stenotomum]
MQIMKGLKKGETTFIATIASSGEDNDAKKPLPLIIEKVLEEEKREVDHKIELEVGAKSPVHAHYLMAIPELEELRKQLKELIEAGHIRHAKHHMAHRFISGYSTKADPLTELLKKNKPWVWSEECQKAFESLKAAVTEESVFTLPDFSKTFKVNTNASDFSIGGVLMQDAIKDGMQHDLEAKKLIKLAAQGKTRCMWVEDGFLLNTGRRVYVPKFGSIRRQIIKERHNISWAGHLGQGCTRELIEAIYYWPCMRGRHRVLCANMSGVPARQGGAEATGRANLSTTRSRTAM